MQKYDVIIIGAGIGGLTAGAILSRNGKKVLVLEKNPVVGGYAVNFKRKGFEFDASLHMMQGCNRGGITYNILKTCGINKMLRLVKAEFLYHSYYPNLEIKIRQNNPQEFIEIIKKKFPKEKKGIDLLLKDTKNGLISFENFQKYKKLNSKIKFYLSKTCLDVFNIYIQEPRVISLLSQLWGYFGLPPSNLSAYYLPFLLYDYLYNGGYYPLGGANEISHLLRAVIIQNRGEILLNNEVDKIVINNEKAVGVVVSGGKEFFGDKIISNADARHTFLNLVGSRYLPIQFIKNLQTMKPSISAFQVYLGLEMNLCKLIPPEYEIFINPNFDLDNNYTSFINNELENSTLSITIYSNLEKNIKFRGKTNIVLAGLSGYDYWRNIPEENYKIIKTDLANKLIERAESIIPNLESYIKVMEIATPLTMERYTGNYKGAIYGWAQNLYQCGPRRSFIRTPIKNLHLASAWTHPGGGISGVLYAGELAARYILQSRDNIE